MNSPSGIASQELHNIFTKTVIVPNRDVNFSNQRLKSKGIDKMSVKYITRDPLTKEPVSQPYYTVKVNNMTPKAYTEEQFINSVYNTLGK